MLVAGGKGVLSQYSNNPKTRLLTNKMLVGAGFTVAAIFMIEKFVDTYPFAEFQISEAMQTIGMARWQATEAELPELIPALDALQDLT